MHYAALAATKIRRFEDTKAEGLIGGSRVFARVHARRPELTTKAYPPVSIPIIYIISDIDY